MHAWLDDAFEQGATVVTASRRLARELRSAYAAGKIRSGVQSWETPPVLALNDWCRRLLESADGAHALPDVLGDHLSAVLWERCLRKHAPDGMPAFHGFLRQARDAWRKLQDWAVPLAELPGAARSPDERLFAAAAGDYQAMLESHSATDTAGLSRRIAQLVARDVLSVPDEVFLAGFDRLVPAATGLVDALRAAGCKVHLAAEPESKPQVRVASFEDHETEMRAAGAWARDVLRQYPDATVAIVDPGLQDDAIRESRLVCEGLAPGWQYAHESYRHAVDVSYGRRLVDYPAIGVALLIIKWLRRGLSTKEISLLLRATCIAGAAWSGRSRLELALRKLPDRAWRARDLLHFLKDRDDGADARAWLRGVDAVVAVQEEAAREASPAHWASRFDALLEAWSWPGADALTSPEFQLVNRWRDLLNELAETAIVVPQVSLGEAVDRLAGLAEDVVFQPQAEGSLVVLMGTLEAAGMQFDHLWVCGMHAANWPPAGNPSPLIPRRLQKAYGLPDATPADTLRYSRRVFERLAHCAPDIVFSWPRSDGEAELAASGFLDSVPHATNDGPDDPGWHAARFCSKDANLAIADDAVPAVGADETVLGGAYTVQRQYVEPFAAFAYGRLGIKRADAIEPGIAPRVRGVVIHNALHNLFAECPTLADIRTWASADLNQRLGTAIDAALAGPMRHADETYARLLSLERRYLFRLLRDYVAVESERPEHAVAEVEKAVDYEAYGVRLKLRIDRIDQLADGSLQVIDYKTGQPKNLLTRDGDPADLQLVVYADALDATIGGIGIVNIDSRTINYKEAGGSVESDPLPSEEWPARLAAWRREVHEALREIAAGDVRVNLVQKADEGRPLAILSRLEDLKRVY